MLGMHMHIGSAKQKKNFCVQRLISHNMFVNLNQSILGLYRLDTFISLTCIVAALYDNLRSVSVCKKDRTPQQNCSPECIIPTQLVHSFISSPLLG